MSKQIHIVSGFLGAGKTTFLNRYLPLLQGKTVVIENEAGTVGVDGALLPKDFPVRELSAGCICCTLAPALSEQLEQIEHDFAPDQIVIEPSGVGNLSDIAKHCEKFGYEVHLKIAMVDASEFLDYAENFGTFYMDQVDNATLILLTHHDGVSSEEIKNVVSRIRETNTNAIILESDWREMSDDDLMNLINAASQEACTNEAFSDFTTSSEGRADTLRSSTEAQKTASPLRSKSVTLREVEMTHGQIHKGYETHHHHHDHDFKNNGFEQLMFTNLKPWTHATSSEIDSALKSGDYGEVFRAKGFVDCEGKTNYFDFTPKHLEFTKMSEGARAGELRFIVIGKSLNEQKLATLLSE